MLVYPFRLVPSAVCSSAEGKFVLTIIARLFDYAEFAVGVI